MINNAVGKFDAELTHCPNCAHELSPAGAAFCSHCGQDAHLRPPSISDFLQQFGGNIISTEGALWRSVRLLLTQPGQLTVEYWRGRRKHYVMPIRLYLTMSVIFLICFNLINSKKFEKEFKNEIKLAAMINNGEAVSFININTVVFLGFDKGQFVCKGIPEWLCERGKIKFSKDSRASAQVMVNVINRSLDHAAQLFFILAPIFAIWLKILYWRHQRFYTEHLVHAFHFQTFCFIVLLVSQLPIHSTWFSLGLLLSAAAYLMMSLQRIFGGAMWKNVIKTMLLIAIQSMVFLFCTLSLIALAALI